MLKKYQIVTKTLFQILVYIFEMSVVSLGGMFFMNKFYPAVSFVDSIERVLLLYGIYQILVVVILTNLNDIEKDSYLALSSILKQCILYKETEDEAIKISIHKSIKYQMDKGTFNYNKFREMYNLILSHIDDIEKRKIELELINVETAYELSSLNWRYSFLLRMIK